MEPKDGVIRRTVSTLGCLQVENGQHLRRHPAHLDVGLSRSYSTNSRFRHVFPAGFLQGEMELDAEQVSFAIRTPHFSGVKPSLA